MESLATIQARLDAATDISALFTSAGEAFELTRAVADDYAIPGSLTFATWGQITVASCEGRDAVGYPPTYFPPELGGLEEPPTRQDPFRNGEDKTFATLATLVAALQRALSRGQRDAIQPNELTALRQAEIAAQHIRELLS